MKPVVDGLKDQVNWENLVDNLQLKDQLWQHWRPVCRVQEQPHTAIATTTCMCQCGQDHQDQKVGSSSTGMSGYKLPWSRGAVETTSPGCWMNQEQNFNVDSGNKVLFCFTTNNSLPVLEEWGLGFSEGPNKTFPWSSGNERQGEVD